MNHEQSLPPFGFILTRCVLESAHDRYWKEAHGCIRSLFTDVPIIIIDDHSDVSLVHDDMELDANTTVVLSHLPRGAGEFVPYHYLYTYTPFQKAVVMHDSMFLQRKEPLLSVLLDDAVDFKFLWFFTRCRLHMMGYQHMLVNELHASERQSLLDLQKGTGWYGCFGGCSVISLSYLQRLQEKYGFMNLSKVMRTRRFRMAFERVLALCCMDAHNVTHTAESISIYGNIDLHFTAFKYRFGNYLADKKDGHVREPCVKVWTGR